MKSWLVRIASVLGGQRQRGTRTLTLATETDGPKRHELRWTLAYSTMVATLFVSVMSKSWWMSGAALSMVCIFLWLSTAGAIARAFYDRGRDTFQGQPELTEGAHEIGDNPAIGLAAVLEGIVAPERLYVRIKERVSPQTKAFQVQTSYTLQFPSRQSSRKRSGNKKVEVELVPLILAEKGALYDDLRILFDGSECPAASFEESVRIALLAARSAAVQAAGTPMEFVDYLDELEEDLFTLISSRRTHGPNNTKVDRNKERLRRRKQGQELRRRIRRHFEPSSYRDTIEAIAGTLATHYIIYIAVTPERAKPGAMLAFETIERHLLAPSTRELLRVPSTPLGSFASRVGNALRRIYGMSPSDISYPLSKAFQSDSYHLEIMGFEGSYLSRQRFYEAAGTSLRYRRFRSRRGQRYAHLYVRGLRAASVKGARIAALWDESPHVAVEFEERPPGSFAPSAFSSLAASLIILVAFKVSLHPLAGSTDIVALLMAAPGAILGWSGFLTEFRRFGSVAARVSATVTLIASLAAFLQFTLGGSPRALFSGTEWLWSTVGVDPAGLFLFTWTSLCAVSLVNTTLIWTFWAQRTLVHATFVDDETASLVAKSTGVLTKGK